MSKPSANAPAAATKLPVSANDADKDRFKRLTKIGKGSFGDAFKGSEKFSSVTHFG